MDRWEHGSDFHWTSLHEGACAVAPWGDGPAWLASGRDAFRCLIEHLRETSPCRRVWLPTFYCDDVVASLAAARVEVQRYVDHPLLTSAQVAVPRELGSDDVVVLVNYFGLRRAPDVRTRAVVVEDHTHDPWSSWAVGSGAAYCLASLRKTLPIPDGAVIWSPTRRSLPAPAAMTVERRLAVADRLGGMILKAGYLAGARVEKAQFRELLTRGERGLASGGVSGASEVARAVSAAFPTATWRQAREANHRALASGLEACPGLTLMRPEPGCVPFCLTAMCESEERRDRLRAELASRAVYTAVLWKQRATSPPDADRIEDDGAALSRRLLSLQCDGRYSAADLARVAAIVKAQMTSSPEVSPPTSRAG